jgi:hypothetical protein
LTYTYILTTDIGRIRLLCQDTDTTGTDPLRRVFTDEELQAYLTMESDVVKLAAAQACDEKATYLLLVLKDETSRDYTIRASGMAASLRERANRLRLDVEMDGSFDIAETDWEEIL